MSTYTNYRSRVVLPLCVGTIFGLMASLDTRRPAAMEQLAVLGTQIGVATLPVVAGQGPVDIARRAMEAGATGFVVKDGPADQLATVIPPFAPTGIV